MIQRMKQAIISVVASALVLVPLAIPVSVSAVEPSIEENICAGQALDVNAKCDPQTAGEASGTRVNNIIATVINLFSLVVGVVSVIMIIIGGLKYITSGGDSGNVTGAKNTILYAVIGLVVVALAQVIVKFVLGRATQTT
jgi:hypothetical protein